MVRDRQVAKRDTDTPVQVNEQDNLQHHLPGSCEAVQTPELRVPVGFSADPVRRAGRPRRARVVGGQPGRYVGRGSKFGNPFVLGHKQYGLIHYGPKHLERFGREWDYEGRISAPGMTHNRWLGGDGDVVRTEVRLATAAEVVELYRLTITDPT